MSDFDLRALYDALDEERSSRDLTWAQVARELSRHHTRLRPVSSSTITNLKTKSDGEGDGILQMLVWLGRSPESFVAGFPDADAKRFQLPMLKQGQILRWDTPALFAALNARRQEREWTWAQVARDIGGFTPTMLTNLASGPRIGFPRVMRLIRWLGEAAVTFTRIAPW